MAVAGDSLLFQGHPGCGFPRGSYKETSLPVRGPVALRPGASDQPGSTCGAATLPAVRSQAARARADGVPEAAAAASDGTGPPAAGLRCHWRGVTILTVVAALVYVTDALIRFRHFLSSTFDLVIFDQGIRGYAHFSAPVSIARGVADGGTAHFLLLSDHWSPLLAVLAPFY